MSLHTGTQYEGKARKELAKWNVFSVGLEPDASPDLIIPQHFLGIEVKSTRTNTYYLSKNRKQYEYLKNQFPIDWPGYHIYYMIYFFRSHCWKVFKIASKSPFKANEGIPLNDFISSNILKANINYIHNKNKIEVKK